jgi:asparagine synthase (glutamine-hydrolysing)
MSGIVGMINLDGSPIDRRLLDGMTGFLGFRGPDAQTTWIDGPVGFGHALLRTTVEAEREQQPCSLDDEVWITADARVDDRANLIAKLAGHGRQNLRDVPDALLILHAYHVWGQNCVRHLLGDFAFAIWDGRERQLLCARDHFGIKPFFYAAVESSFIFGNTLNCIRLHPGVSDDLDDRAIGDFLLCGSNHDKEATAFADIRRLPPAHILQWHEGGHRLSRYWDVPVDGEIRYRRPEDYVAHFGELFRSAVADRLRVSRVTVSMSGGLDSSSVAAVARDLGSSGTTPIDLRAGTFVFDTLIPDEERHYAGEAARALDIPIGYVVADGYRLFERWDEPDLHKPEPIEGPAAAALLADHNRACAAHGRVVLTGEGGDPLQYGSTTYVLNLLKRGRWGRAAFDCWQSLRHGRLPRVGFRARLRRLLGTNVAWKFPYPEWLEGDFARRFRLAERLKEINDEPPALHRNRPETYRVLVSAYWLDWLEHYDPGPTQCALEFRHPYLDLRVVNFLLAIPPLPWSDNKRLVRQTMRGLLPEKIRLRPKAPLAGEPVRELLQREESRWIDRFVPTAELNRYVNRRAVPALAGETDLGRIWTHLRPLSLQFWLRNRNAFRGIHKKEVDYHGNASSTGPEEALSGAKTRCLW